MKADAYIVAVKRERRDDAPPDWLERIGAIDGVSVVGSSPKRAQIKADSAGIAQVRDSLGDYMHIEPVIPHYTQ